MIAAKNVVSVAGTWSSVDQYRACGAGGREGRAEREFESQHRAPCTTEAPALQATKIVSNIVCVNAALRISRRHNGLH